MKKICKVLIVEDNPDIQQILGDVLDGDGYRFIVAGNGAEMRQRLIDEPDIDVAVIDITLPGGEDGFALAKEVADQGFGVILVTGDHRHYERVEKGVHRYLFKPFRMRSLLELVQGVIVETQRKCKRGGRQRGMDPTAHIAG